MTSAAANRELYVGIDIGGTFVDVVVYDTATRELHLTKASSTPRDPATGFFNGIDRLMAQDELNLEEISRLLHGSTVATNAVLEAKGSRIGLITTEGFRHILEIGRAYIPGIFTNYMRWEKPERLVPLERVREIPERLAVDGSVVRPLDEAAVRQAIEELLTHDIEALAIALLHSYVNPNHERRVAEIARELAPELYISCSSDVLPEYREYERTMTTVLNAYVMPVVARYLEHIAAGLEERGVPAKIQIVRSDAGVMSLTAARERPVNTVLSGPAGGVQGATYVAAAAGFPNIVSMDMGGTSTDVCLSTAAEPRLSTDTWVSHYPVKVPLIDITTIGAGGGSLAYVSSAGALRVGPQSAGADPGPACYGRGGTRPTVTDANAVLGRLPLELAGGALRLDIAAAKAAIDEHIARPLGLTVEAAAHGILRIVNESMLGALRVVSVQQGIDPRDLVLVPFGGAGPVHGAEMARLAGISTMLVPPTPGVLSALGFLLADVTNVFTRTRVGVIGALDVAAYNRELAQLVEQADAWLDREGIAPAARAVEITLDLRYQGQAYELPIKVDRELDGAAWQQAAARFHAEHKTRYGFDQPFAPVEVVTLRVTAIGHVPTLTLQPGEEAGPDARHAIVTSHPVYFGDGFRDTPIYDRAQLLPGNIVPGPALITQPDSTTLLHPEQTARVDGYGNLIVQIGHDEQ